MDKPIGIFDSGIGGLTVVKELMRQLPAENLVYFGDTARIPYGTKSEKLIRQYALEDAAFLQQFDIKLLVVACNSASAVAVDLLTDALDIPVTGVIVPGVLGALRESKNRRIGVIGTTATVSSGAYNRKIHETESDAFVSGQPCPLLVPLVEEGWLDDEITHLTIRKYLAPLLAREIDTIILGCTHFPVIKPAIRQEVGEAIHIIDSGEEAARHVGDMLTNLSIGRQEISQGNFKFFVSDIPRKFEEVGSRFLGRAIDDIERVDFDAFLMENGEQIYKPLTVYNDR